MNEANESDVKKIIYAANSWCKRKMTRDSIIIDAMDRLHKFVMALDKIIEEDNCENERKDFTETYHSLADSLVECGI